MPERLTVPKINILRREQRGPERPTTRATALQCEMTGRWHQALDLYRQNRLAAQHDWITIKRIADLLVRLNRLEEAAHEFSRLAEISTAEGSFRMAVAAWKQVVRLAPSTVDPYMRLGDLYAKQSLVAEAKGCYAFAVAEYTRLGKSQDATQVLQKVARIDPNDLKVVICLAEVYARRGDSELAGECYVSVARALVAKGYSKEASQLLQKAVRSGINSEALRNELARHADPGATRGPTKS